MAIAASTNSNCIEISNMPLSYEG